MPIKSYVEVRKRFTKSVEALVAMARSMFESTKNQGQSKNYSPDKNGWTGDLFDLDGISKAFDRSEHVTDVQQTVASAENSGTVGDLVASVKQGDYIAVQERAYRALHVGRVRATMHSGARYYGHQHEAGLFQKGVKGEIADIVRKAKDFSS